MMRRTPGSGKSARVSKRAERNGASAREPFAPPPMFRRRATLFIAGARVFEHVRHRRFGKTKQHCDERKEQRQPREALAKFALRQDCDPRLFDANGAERDGLHRNYRSPAQP
jgi:hypothetical protein